ncbi:MAG TPA: hypothetical protein VJK90_18300, partial [Acetobacteraceae bacterium]|nr:hypothetical protein [Acetobacteraceae bacterium]
MRRRWLLGGMAGTALTTALGGSGCSVLPSQPYLQRRDWPLVVQRSDALAGPAPVVSRPAGRGGGLVLL